MTVKRMRDDVDDVGHEKRGKRVDWTTLVVKNRKVEYVGDFVCPTKGCNFRCKTEAALNKHGDHAEVVPSFRDLDPDTDRLIPLRNALGQVNKYAAIELADWGREIAEGVCICDVTWSNWSANSDYVAGSVGTKRVKLHNAVMNHLWAGPGGLSVDHLYQQHNDNRRRFLRVATSFEQAQNKRKRVGTTSKFRGVHFNVFWKKWHARLRIHGKEHHIGYYATEEEAAAAYNVLVRHCNYGDFIDLNDVPDIPSLVVNLNTDRVRNAHGVAQRENGTYRTYHTWGGQKYKQKTFPTEAEAIKHAIQCESEIDALKQQKKRDRFVVNGDTATFVAGGVSILVDADSIDKLLEFTSFSRNKQSGAVFCLNKNSKTVSLSEVVMGKALDEGLIWDHIKPGVDAKNDYRCCNLRPANRSLNTQNSKARSASGFKGVSKQGDRWVSRITHQGCRQKIGVYDTKEEAAEAYDQAALNVYGTAAFLNFPTHIIVH